MPLLFLFRCFVDITQTFKHILCCKLHKACHSILKFNWCWFHSKIFIFRQVMAKKWCPCPYLGHNLTFLSQLGWYFLWKIRRLLSFDWYLEIQVIKLIYHFYLATIGGKIGVATMLAPNGLGLLNTNKKLAHWVRNFGPTTISKSCIQNL